MVSIIVWAEQGIYYYGYLSALDLQKGSPLNEIVRRPFALFKRTTRLFAQIMDEKMDHLVGR